MTDKRKQTLRTQLGPRLTDEIRTDLIQYLFEVAGEPDALYLLRHAFSKYVGPDTAPAELRQGRAIEKWLKTEQRNEQTNTRLLFDEVKFSFAESETILRTARKFVQKVIGADPPRSLFGAFSGGASTLYKREPGSAARKFMGQASVTREAWPFVLPMILEATAWWKLNPEVLDPWIVDGNVMFTVPKSTDIDRVACKEPELNMYAQKACGDFIRRRLKRFGIDLNDQSINRDLAREGSKGGHLATLDLSSASDSVSTVLVSRLLSPGWFVLLDAIRSKRTLIGDKWHENHMFSSMGNGFTFELESLIFYSLVRAVAFHARVRGKISVYGDDIICPRQIAKSVQRVFAFMGFTVNSQKSFWTGPIRESCGGHYHRGVDITPFYVKEPIDNVERLIHFLNRLRRWAGQATGICDPRVEPLWSKYARLVDRRLWGGDDLARPTQLVSNHKSRFKLVPVVDDLDRVEDELQTGLYLQSLNGSQTIAVNNALREESVDEPYRMATVVQNSRGQSFAAVGVNLLHEAVDWSLATPLISKSAKLQKVRERQWRLHRHSKSLKETSSVRLDFPVWLTPTGTYL